MKKFSIFVLVIAVIAALTYFFFPLEMIVKKVVNKYGSEVVGTDVSLQGFKLNPMDGFVEVKEITVANPANYKTKYAVQLGNISVKVNMDSILTDTIIVDEILVNKPVISYEMMSLTQNNIADIISNVNKYSTSSSASTTDTKVEANAEVKEDNSSAKKVIIKKVVISNGEINGAMTAAPDVISASIPLPTVTLTNIGEKSKGTSIADSIAMIMNKLLSSVSTTVISSNMANLKDVANDAVDATKETANSVVDGVKDTLKSINIFGD